MRSASATRRLCALALLLGAGGCSTVESFFGRSDAISALPKSR